MKFVKCRECMLKRKGGKPWKGWYCYNVGSIKGGIRGCENGLSYKEVEQEKAKHARKKYRQARVEKKVGDELALGSMQWNQLSHSLMEVTDRKVRDNTSTFLCEKCGEAVQVPSDMLGKELFFRCHICHHENHYDLRSHATFGILK